MRAFCQRIHTEGGETSVTFTLPDGRSKAVPLGSERVREYVTVVERKGFLRKLVTTERLETAPAWQVGRHYEIED